jgi:hypothetical protein
MECLSKSSRKDQGKLTVEPVSPAAKDNIKISAEVNGHAGYYANAYHVNPA